MSYQPPSSSQAGGGAGMSNTAGTGGTMGGGLGAAPQQAYKSDDQDATRMNYQCGDCGSIDTYRVRTATRCPSCGGRVLYKLRTKRMIQFEAR